MNSRDIIFLIFSILIPLLFLIKPIVSFKSLSVQKGLISFCKVNRWTLITVFFLIVGFIIRLYKIGQFPLGFNQDEASLGYDAYSIMNFGIDRNGIHLPVHLVSWGSGQNALYAYICMPFIRLFGLTEFAIRLPMALIGCISLVVMKKILETIGTAKLAAIGTFLFAILPWHIMKSRWGLESNIFPDLILLAVLLIILGLNDKKWLFFTGSAVLGLSAYAYGTSYFFLPVFSLIIMIYLLYNKKINFHHAIVSMVIIFITALPILLFILINQFGWNSLHTPFFTIPQLNSARQATIINLEGNIFNSLFCNFKNGLSLLLLQTDGLPWNSLAFYGTHYVISLPFLALGIFAMFRKKGFGYDYIFFIWLISSLLMIFIMDANINRINIVYLPILYFIALGVNTVITGIKGSWIPVLTIYVLVGAMFLFTYFGNYQSKISYYFFEGLGDAIGYSNELNTDKIIISNKINAPYIFVLFYNKTNPNNYIDSVDKLNEGAEFEEITGFEQFRFSNININYLDKSAVYIIETSNLDNIKTLYPEANFNVFQKYIVVNFK